MCRNFCRRKFIAGKNFCNASVNFSPTPDILSKTKYRIYDVYSGVRTRKCIQRCFVSDGISHEPRENARPQVKSSKLYVHWARWLCESDGKVWRSRNAPIDRKLEKMTSIITIESGIRWSEQYVVSCSGTCWPLAATWTIRSIRPTARRVVILRENYILL